MFVADRINHPSKGSPPLLGGGFQIWSWDITKLCGPQKHVFYNAYVALESGPLRGHIYSRYIPGWMIADVESGDLAKQCAPVRRGFVAETCAAWKIVPNVLTLHADKSGPSRGHGPPMKSKCLYHLLEDLGVAKSHSRPRTPVRRGTPPTTIPKCPFRGGISESFFKTTKYHATFPSSFANIEQARDWMDAFVTWYNIEHHHSGLAMKVALPGLAALRGAGP